MIASDITRSLDRPWIHPGPDNDDLARDAVHAILSGERVIAVTAHDGAEKARFLERLAGDLSRDNARVVHIGGQDDQPLTLKRVMRQVLGANHDDGGTDPVERFFDLLTVPQGSESQLVLIVDGADRLTADTLGYLALVMSVVAVGPLPLQIVLVGREEMWEQLLKRGDLPVGGISTRLVLAGPIEPSLGCMAFSAEQIEVPIPGEVGGGFETGDGPLIFGKSESGAKSPADDTIGVGEPEPRSPVDTAVTSSGSPRVEPCPGHASDLAEPDFVANMAGTDPSRDGAGPGLAEAESSLDNDADDAGRVLADLEYGAGASHDMDVIDPAPTEARSPVAQDVATSAMRAPNSEPSSVHATDVIGPGPPGPGEASDHAPAIIAEAGLSEPRPDQAAAATHEVLAPDMAGQDHSTSIPAAARPRLTLVAVDAPLSPGAGPSAGAKATSAVVPTLAAIEPTNPVRVARRVGKLVALAVGMFAVAGTVVALRQQHEATAGNHVVQAERPTMVALLAAVPAFTQDTDDRAGRMRADFTAPAAGVVTLPTEDAPPHPTMAVATGATSAEPSDGATAGADTGPSDSPAATAPIAPALGDLGSNPPHEQSRARPTRVPDGDQRPVNGGKVPPEPAAVAAQPAAAPNDRPGSTVALPMAPSQDDSRGAASVSPVLALPPAPSKAPGSDQGPPLAAESTTVNGRGGGAPLDLTPAAAGQREPTLTDGQAAVSGPKGQPNAAQPVPVISPAETLPNPIPATNDGNSARPDLAPSTTATPGVAPTSPSLPAASDQSVLMDADGGAVEQRDPAPTSSQATAPDPRVNDAQVIDRADKPIAAGPPQSGVAAVTQAAPADATETKTTTVAPASTTVSADVLRVLLSRGDELMRTGDIVSARLMYERAAAAGSARAAVAAGMTHDPGFLAQIGARGIAADPRAAAKWYRRAVALGDDEGKSLLAKLGAAANE